MRNRSRSFRLRGDAQILSINLALVNIIGTNFILRFGVVAREGAIWAGHEYLDLGISRWYDGDMTYIGRTDG